MLFNEPYRVLAVDDEDLIVRGVHSGEVLTIRHAESGMPISKDQYPVGGLLRLEDPGATPEN